MDQDKHDDFERPWIDLQRRILLETRNRQYDVALKELESYLQRNLPDDYRAEALALRAEIKEKDGRSKEALEDLILAQALSEIGSYARYTIELTLGRLNKKLAIREEAIAWYRRAVETTIVSTDVSAGSAIKSLLDLIPEVTLSSSDRDLVMRALHHSWAHLGKPVPQTGALMEAATMLLDQESQPPEDGSLQ